MLVVTKSVLLGVAEFASHYVIDRLKINDHITFTFDQFLHILMKLIYVGVVYASAI